MYTDVRVGSVRKENHVYTYTYVLNAHMSRLLGGIRDGIGSSLQLITSQAWLEVIAATAAFILPLERPQTILEKLVYLGLLTAILVVFRNAISDAHEDAHTRFLAQTK